MSTEIFELEGNDRKAYFEHDEDVWIESGDEVVITLYHDIEAATYQIVPEGENAANFPTEEDDYAGVVAWLIEHDYTSKELIAARKGQLGIEACQ